MFLNANTATRRFRELDFDLKAFLDAMNALRPYDGSTPWYPYAQVRWADGSVDVAPVFDLIRYVSENYDPVSDVWCNLYSSLSVGNASLTPSTSENALCLSLDGVPLSARISSLEGIDASKPLRIENSRIRKLFADSVMLPPDADIHSLDTSEVDSVSGSMKSVRATNKLIVRTGSFPNVDVHQVRISPMLRYSVDRVDASCISDMAGAIGSTKPRGFSLSGATRLSRTASVPMQTVVAANGTSVSVEVPVKISGGYSYMATVPTAVPQDVVTPLDIYSAPNVVSLYPFVQVMGYSEMKNIRIRIGIPEAMDDGRVVQVNNSSGSDLRVCNAWMFTSGGGAGIVQPLNYVTLSAYTTVDYMVRFDDSGSGLRVYMLPMSSIVR